ncbi:hypothetical protein GN958_ATG11591 [Phytophthora infestans]|uniref:Uncharacterized protein n=1 Tax=Phytophthora infestans TaxID=4787 RepID=A0A8S9UEQ4_PHYIN|nr:hypothetical protein GN958_ATG11591 [Phytophthora infestans]
MLEDFHDRYLNVALTANLPPTVCLSKRAPHAELFKAFFQANTDGRFGMDMMRAFLADVKRLEFDGAHALKVVFYSRFAADRWVLKTLRFQRAVITLQDTARVPGDTGAGTFTAAQLDLQYAIDIYDNRYHTVRFAQSGCPQVLQDVTNVELEGKTLILHHFQTRLRRPCGRCFSPRHGGKKCMVAAAALRVVRARFSRIFTGAVDNVQPVHRDDYTVSSAEKLVELLTSMQVDAAMQMETLLTCITL